MMLQRYEVITPKHGTVKKKISVGDSTPKRLPGLVLYVLMAKTIPLLMPEIMVSG
jgi:hypothetical protein